MECSMPYRADVSEPDPSPSIISKYLSVPDPGGYPSSDRRYSKSGEIGRGSGMQVLYYKVSFNIG